MTKTQRTETTLRGRMTIQLGLMVIGSLLIGVGAIVGINGLHNDLGVAVQGYRELRQLYEVGFNVAQAKEALATNRPDAAKALAAMETAQLKLDLSYYGGSGDLPPYWLDESKREECRVLVRSAIEFLKQPGEDDALRVDQLSAVNDMIGKLSALSADIRLIIVARQERADANRHFILSLIVGLSAGVVIVALVVGVRQYRGVVGPLDLLGGAVRRFAAGKFSDRIIPRGDREFAALAGDFNHMADELEGLYRELEEKVEAKSRELVRSERLASVGYLAAGVAHEINNPLGIIAGYGERSLELLDRGMNETTLPATRKTIQIICEEAFRCKGITDRLLSLARPGTDDRCPVSLRDLAEDVIENIGGLPEYSNRRITFESDLQHELMILARDGEIKQVLINLLLNALEATEPRVGEVHVAIAKRDEEIEMTVADNGRGMTSATLQRIFEPFFTDKRGSRNGVGLGLSITHAIVAKHGGRISAGSGGVGLGSRFVVTLPAALKEVELARG